MTVRSRQSARGRALEAPSRFLRPFATPAGAICALALDHRDAMRNAYKRVGIANVDEATMLDAKARIIDVLGGVVSAMLLDPPAVVRARPAGVGVFVPLEEQGHAALEGGRLTPLLQDFGPADAQALGVDGCKLLLYYRADHAATAQRQRDLVVRVATDCHRHGLPLVVEPLVYRLKDEDEQRYARRYAELVVAAARDLAGSGADLLKLQFPGDQATCEQLTRAASPLPWVLLGGSEIDGETFADQLRTACAAGACGFIAGRAIWGGALSLEPGDQSDWLERHALPLLQRLTDTADRYARRIQ